MAGIDRNGGRDGPEYARFSLLVAVSGPRGLGTGPSTTLREPLCTPIQQALTIFHGENEPAPKLSADQADLLSEAAIPDASDRDPQDPCGLARSHSPHDICLPQTPRCSRIEFVLFVPMHRILTSVVATMLPHFRSVPLFPECRLP